MASILLYTSVAGPALDVPGSGEAARLDDIEMLLSSAAKHPRTCIAISLYLALHLQGMLIEPVLLGLQ